ncbi:two-component response regulator ARR10-like [Cynara cardunculus var. scolymus]|uniref:two-component response regulator ARR10-like n=1 Tax=Cynara cardunculus var. scolymus TaxID=59895 RepID=UPI000D623D06|nr:two-component response regulator ARR10-like [Cynara cardunculus var. scolymus]
MDEKKDLLASVACLLSSCSFQVTCADNSGLALRLLSEKANEFDLLLIDRDITDVDVYTFIRLAKRIDLLSMVMSEEDDDTIILEALKNGALLVLKRPLTKDAAMGIRQYAIKERIRKHDECQNKNTTRNAARIEERIQDNHRCLGRKRTYRGKPTKHLVYQSSEDYDDRVKTKIRVEWTRELHDKFLHAAIQLGEGRCYPKEILDLMDVPGLTRTQVASHLQKCRDGRCKYTEKGRMANSSCNISPQGVNGRKFDCKPSLQSDQNEGEDRINLDDLSLSLNGCRTEVNHMNDQSSRGLPTANGSSRQNHGGQAVDTGSVHVSSSN